MIHKITTAISLTVCAAYLVYAAYCWRKVKKERVKAVAAWENLHKAAEVHMLELMENTAHWIMHDDELGLTCECSNCHIETCGDTPFCPHCGRFMRKKEAQDDAQHTPDKP